LDVSLFFRMALSIISAFLSGMAASTVGMLLAIPAAGVLKDVGAASHGMMMFVSFRDAPLFIGVSVFLIILCRDARGEHLRRD
jgi:hypothetical protein